MTNEPPQYSWTCPLGGVTRGRKSFAKRSSLTDVLSRRPLYPYGSGLIMLSAEIWAAEKITMSTGGSTSWKGNPRNSKILYRGNGSTISTHEESKTSRPFIWMKVYELVFAVVILMLHSDAWVLILLGKNGDGSDIHAAMTPFVATVSILLFAPACVLGHFFRQRTPIITMLAMDVIGLVLFATTSALCFIHWDQVKRIIMSISEDGFLDDQPPQVYAELEKALMNVTSSSVRLANDKLLMEGIMSGAVTAVFAIDIFLTVKYGVIRGRKPKAPLVVQYLPSPIPD
ncbi:hypothetical protein J437_LFUL001239 [Ladona fulva]|uniref:Uncharacterized protein n=1 Tax=Ladona fulva TaxID=123851 RepID=A0A8K0JVZ0_LADFU|nr:hypothetical protein J437_LFUL001239 [Ladona fulva]